jgi:hypothetical protein
VQAVGNCQFVFLKHKTSETLTKIFVKRLQRAFSAVELNMADYVVMQPALTDAAYHRLNDIADVFSRFSRNGWHHNNAGGDYLQFAHHYPAGRGKIKSYWGRYLNSDWTQR